jgi:hypothetical protein
MHIFHEDINSLIMSTCVHLTITKSPLCYKGGGVVKSCVATMQTPRRTQMQRSTSYKEGSKKEFTRTRMTHLRPNWRPAASCKDRILTLPRGINAQFRKALIMHWAIHTPSLYENQQQLPITYSPLTNVLPCIYSVNTCLIELYSRVTRPRSWRPP